MLQDQPSDQAWLHGMALSIAPWLTSEAVYDEASAAARATRRLEAHFLGARVNCRQARHASARARLCPSEAQSTCRFLGKRAHELERTERFIYTSRYRKTGRLYPPVNTSSKTFNGPGLLDNAHVGPIHKTTGVLQNQQASAAYRASLGIQRACRCLPFSRSMP